MASAAIFVVACSGGASSDPVAGPIVVAPSKPVDPLPPQENDSLELPVEVLGPDGHVVDVGFNLGFTRRYIQRLRLTCSRCGYRDSVNDADRTKASVRFNDGPWLPINSATAILDDKTRAYGGLAGAQSTIDLEVELGQWSVEGRNTLSFRFEGTDGYTNGFRIIDADFVTAASPEGERVAKAFDDPADWEPKRASDFELGRGAELWRGERGPELRESPLSDRRIKAACADCHSSDGRDLKYFNYSNESIEARARFHGLDQRQAERISSYIRSLDVPAPASARPWNPPYQPGPGLDSRPVEEWAAGAGLEWVLDSDADMVPYLFPEGTGFQDVRRVFDREKTLNVREMPIAVQFPDWKSWLPEVHPMDVWPEIWASDAPLAEFESIVADFTEVQPDDRTPQRVRQIFQQLNVEVRNFIGRGKTEGPGTQWRTLAGELVDSRDPRYTVEDAKRSMASWSAVKQWEIVQRFGLEDDAPRLHPEGGELRSWPGQGQNVHQMAAHITAANMNNWTFQQPVVGDHGSSLWYQLQMTLNSGQRQNASVQPQDWPYQFRHIFETGEQTGIWEPARYVQSIIKSYQNANNGRGQGQSGWQLRFTHPYFMFRPSPGTDGLMAEWDFRGANLRRRMTNAGLLEFLDHVEPLDVDDDWLREKDGVPCNRTDVSGVVRWWCVAPKSQVPVVPDQPFRNNLGSHHADQFWVLIPELTELGVPEGTIQRLRDWCKRMWPEGDWESR